MFRYTRARTEKPGVPPGTVVHTEGREAGKVSISIIDYDEEHVQELSTSSPDDCSSFRDTPSVTWVNVVGIHEPGIIEDLGARFHIHPLVLEDIANVGQRPKTEEYEGYAYISLKMLSYDEGRGQVDAEQVSLILMPSTAISFQEREGDVFDVIRERIRNKKGRIRSMGVDYLVYALIDAIVDNYFAVMERLGEKVEALEEAIVSNPDPAALRTLHGVKRELILLRRSVWPLREVISGLQRNESPLVTEKTRVYLRDVYDHTIQVIDTVETLRDMASGMLEMYLSTVSNRMNEVMKVLTIIATLFIPLTFVAGVYGMNFKYMPELECRYSYPIVLAIMLGVCLVMLAYFRKKKWL